MKRSSHAISAFTLIELLVVIAIIGILAALLFPALSQGQSQGRSAACRNNLRQTGVAMQMYVSECERFPSIHDWEAEQLWMDKLQRYAPLSWTNDSWNCPTYIARNGIAVFWATNTVNPRDGARWWTSYAYNANGIIGNGWNGWQGTATVALRGKLGLGSLPRLVAREVEVIAPSETYAVADARSYRRDGPGWFPIESPNATLGLYGMTPWRDAWFWEPSLQSLRELAPPHDQGYNMLYCDGHVSLVKRIDYLFPPRTARHWNRDNQPHEQNWAPTSQWAVQR